MGPRRTIPHHLHALRAERSGEPIYRIERLGHWQTIQWQEAHAEAERIAAALYGLGCRQGDRIAILSETRAEWSVTDLAVLSLGAVVVGIYPTSAPEQMAYVLEHSGARVLFVENETLAAKIRPLCPKLAELRTVVGFEPLSAGPAAPATWLSLEALEEQGRQVLGAEPSLGARCLDQVRPELAATIVYTSGTTGPPKGAVLTHANLFEIAEAARQALGLSAADESVLFLPMAHSLLRVAAYSGLLAGTVGAFCPAIDRLPAVMQQMEPTTMVGVPRFFEKIQLRVLETLAKQPRRRQRLFAAALRVGQAHGRYLERGERIPVHVALAFHFFDRLVLSRVRARIFGRRLRWMVSGGAPMAREVLEFFRGLGVLVLEGYGLTETSAPATLNRMTAHRLGTVGRPMPGVSVRVAEDGEVLIKGAGVFREYYRDPEATAAAFTPDGWFRSGDVGAIDAEGYLTITDRKKDLIVTAGGKNIAPQNIESLVRSDPRVSQVLVHGDRRSHLVALVTIDPEATRGWLERERIPVRPAEPLSSHPAVVQMVSELIEGANAGLARHERVRDFRIVGEDFSIENGLLTPTLKLRRRDVEKRYGGLLDEMYARASIR